jgi:hypothetical protein
MSYSIGGVLIKRMELTASHGLTPASASIEGYGSGSLPSGSPVTLNIGSFVFNGVVTNCVEQIEEGRSLRITVTDNRIYLQDDVVYGTFNNVEIIEDNPFTPGIDRKKRYWHIYPDDWSSQKKTYTNAPLTAQQICQKAFAADTVNHSWSASYTSHFNHPVFSVDANTGKKLGSFIQEICDAIGVQMALSGSNFLSFSVKGIGAPPFPPALNSTDISDGDARGPQATRVRVVGDRNLYQDMAIDLVADWSDHFEQFWFKPAWVAHVIDWWGLSADPSDRAEAEALAREVTLREYIAQTGRTDVADYGTWGEVSRMEIPVWIYIDDIVFKAYRVPDNYQINGISIDSLELRDGLICAVEGGATGVLNYKTDELYPEAKAFCLVQGQPVSLYDPKTKEGITPAQFALMRTLWQPNNRFNLDTKNKAIVFEEALFKDNSGAPLFKQPNIGKSGLTDEVLNLVVPNAAAAISAASVRASICFEAERFSKDYGSGQRNEARYVSGLANHTLLVNGAFSQELKYADNKTADELADQIGNALLVADEFIPSGGFTRWGVAGMTLNGAIDRITVTLYFESGGEGEGISEHVEYSKERSPSHFESTLELQRRNASRDLFPGQKALQEEARQDRLLGKLLKEKKRQSERGFENLDAFTTRLPGNRDCGARYAFATGDGSIPVGTPVFAGDDNRVDQAKKAFAGIITADGVTNNDGWKIPLASQGVVPVRVQGPVSANDSIGCEDGADFGKKDGSKFIGKVLTDYTGSEKVLLPVRLGGGGGSVTRKLDPWEPYASPFIGTGDPPSDQDRRIKIWPGRVDSTLASNKEVELTVPAGAGYDTEGFMVWIRAELDPDTLAMTTFYYEWGTAFPEDPSADFPDVTDPDSYTTPTSIIIMLFTVYIGDDGKIDWNAVEQYVRNSMNCVPLMVASGCAKINLTVKFLAAG